jgi:hypothetical protein
VEVSLYNAGKEELVQSSSAARAHNDQIGSPAARGRRLGCTKKPGFVFPAVADVRSPRGLRPQRAATPDSSHHVPRGRNPGPTFTKHTARQRRRHRSDADAVHSPRGHSRVTVMRTATDGGSPLSSRVRKPCSTFPASALRRRCTYQRTIPENVPCSMSSSDRLT